jgi:hypothetical protein
MEPEKPGPPIAPRKIAQCVRFQVPKVPTNKDGDQLLGALAIVVIPPHCAHKYAIGRAPFFRAPINGTETRSVLCVEQLIDEVRP